MSATSDKEIIQGIVTEIMNARSAGSVTNTMVAQVLRYCVDTLGGRIEDLEGKDESEAIESLAEIAAFLAGITDSQTLSGILSGLRSDLHGEVVAESEARQSADTALDGRITTISEYLTQGYSYGGIASVSGTPGSGRKFYFAVAAGTYTNYGGLTVGNEIAVLKYDDTNWSKDVVFTIDNTPTAASVNPVKSGGVYDFVLGKTLGVVDVANLDTFKAADLRKSDNTQKYLLNYNGRNCGTLHIISDNAGHVVTQIITTHYLYDDSDGTIDWNGHSDNNVVQLYRSVKISGGTLPDNNWTRWNYVNNEILSLLKTNIDNVTSMLGYYRCNTGADVAAKTIDVPNYALTVGGCIKIKFKNANTVASGVTLKIGSAAAMPLYYAGAAVSASNTWEDGETVEVYYDGTSYQANNVAGGGSGDESIKEILTWSIVDDEEDYIQVDVDKNNRVHHAVLRNGSHWFPGGIITTNQSQFLPRPSSGFENFLYTVNVIYDETGSTSLDSIIVTSTLQDRGIICLPVNYSPNGAPVRLVIVQMGTTYKITSSTVKPVGTMPDVNLLLADGFAVMQINGTPGDTEGNNSGSVGNPEFIECFLSAYRYVTNKYNIRRDGIFVSGWSQGSLTSLQIAYLTGIPVLAALSYGPAQSFIFMYSHLSQSVRESLFTKFCFAEKTADRRVVELFPELSGQVVYAPSLSSDFCGIDGVLTDKEKAYLLNNLDKWIAYDMLLSGTSDISVDSMRYLSGRSGTSTDENNVYYEAVKNIPCPLKIFVSIDDPTTTLKYAEWLQTMITNNGQMCSIRKLNSGSHMYPDISSSMSVSTKYGGTITTKAISYEGLEFIKMFDF